MNSLERKEIRYVNQKPSINELFISFLRLGATAFGGPAMVAYIRDLAVTRRQWLDQADFKNGVALCQSIPGAIVMQVAAYVGLKVRGIPGALAAYIGFGLPAFILILALSFLYVRYNNLPHFTALFNGLQVIVVAIVLNAAVSFGRNIISHYRSIIVSILSALFFWLGMSPFLVIVVAGILGMVFLRTPIDLASVNDDKKEPTWRAKEVSFLLAVFLVCLIGLYFSDAILFGLATVMIKIDLFAFGGGFVSLPLMLHEVVSTRQWMDHKTFMDGIALGQITPGPIVITSAFVGYLIHGVPGALVATVAVFAPSFFMVVTVAPFFDRLKRSSHFKSVTEGIYASFVGLLFFVCVTFATAVPWDVVRIILVIAAFLALLRKVDILYIVAAGAAVSIAALR